MKFEIHIDCGEGLTFKRPSLVKPHFADECDLGKIVQRFCRTGELPNLKVKQPLNIDATNLPEDYESLQRMRVDLSNAFEMESEDIREFCLNSVERYAEYLAMTDDERKKAMLIFNNTIIDPPAPPAPPAPSDPSDLANKS